MNERTTMDEHMSEGANTPVDEAAGIPIDQGEDTVARASTQPAETPQPFADPEAGAPMPANAESQKPGGKKGLIVALVALVAVVALAGAAYAALGNRAQPPSEPDFATSATPDAGPSSQQGEASSGEQAPPTMEDFDFTVYDMDGNPVTLSSMKGKPTIVGFWATWCPSCLNEAAEIQSLYDRFGDKVNFMMVDVTDGQRETEQMARDWLSEYGYTYPVYFDTNNLEAAITYQVNVLPTTIVYSKDGTILDYFMGAKPEDEMIAIIDELL